VALTLEEVQRVFDLIESYFAPTKHDLGIEIVRDENQGFILARGLLFTLMLEHTNPSMARKARMAFRCEYPIRTTSDLSGFLLKLSVFHENYDFVGKEYPPDIIAKWSMTPVFNSIDGVVWTNFVEGSIRDMGSEELLGHALDFFVAALERFISFGRPA
jgi:hypothetical protein